MKEEELEKAISKLMGAFQVEISNLSTRLAGFRVKRIPTLITNDNKIVEYHFKTGIFGSEFLRINIPLENGRDGWVIKKSKISVMLNTNYLDKLGLTLQVELVLKKHEEIFIKQFNTGKFNFKKI